MISLYFWFRLKQALFLRWLHTNTLPVKNILKKNFSPCNLNENTASYSSNNLKKIKVIKTTNMKKKIAGLALLALILTTTTFAKNIDDKQVNNKVVTAFNQKFTQASDLKWNVTANYVEATFKMNDQFMFAYFTETGELLGISRNILVNQLPINLQADIKKVYAGSWVTELFELAKDGETTYYITLENADQKVSLKSADGNSWSTYKKVKKNAE